MLPIPDFGRWWAALLFGLRLVFLLLIAAWLLRIFVPVAPTINLGAVQIPLPIAPVGVPDPMLALKASLDDMLNVEKGLGPSLRGARPISGKGWSSASLPSRPCRPNAGPRAISVP
jgi:hypothetical protein